MLKKRSFNFITLSLVFNLRLFMQTLDQNRIYFYVPDTVTQSEAKHYCRNYYTDLATFRNKDDIDALKTASCGVHCCQRCWIGLQRDKTTNVWTWSDGDESNLRQWNKKPENPGENENCVVMKNSVWFDTSCDYKFPFWSAASCDDEYNFLCYEDEPILVQKNKTWEEALEHCRNLHPDPYSGNNYYKHDYDLLHIRSGDSSSTARKVMLDAQTQEVWIGLRFLAGNWLWGNGQPLPVCPAEGDYCGTMSKTGQLVQLRDCSNKRNFICSRN